MILNFLRQNAQASSEIHPTGPPLCRSRSTYWNCTCATYIKFRHDGERKAYASRRDAGLRTANPDQEIRVGLMAYNRCKVKQGGGGVSFGMTGFTALKVLLLHTIVRQKSQGCVCPSTTFMSSSRLRAKPVEKCFCLKWIWLLQVHIPPSAPAAPPLLHYSCPKPSVSSIANMSFSFSCS